MAVGVGIWVWMPDPATRCAELAPDDPYVVDPEQAERAFAACSEASARAPDDVETLYRLGLSALQADRYREAVGTLLAVSDDKCEAFSYLGDAAWFAEHSAEAAEEYYERGADCGDPRSAAAIFSPQAFAPSAFPAHLEALYRSDVEKLNEHRFLTASYVLGFYETLGEQYLSQEFETCWLTTHFAGGKLLLDLRAAEKGDASGPIVAWWYEQSMPWLFRLIAPSQGSTALADFRDVARRAGHADAVRMAELSECPDLLPYKIVRGVEAFAAQKRSLFEVARSVAPEIQSLSDLAKLPWLQVAPAAPVEEPHPGIQAP